MDNAPATNETALMRRGVDDLGQLPTRPGGPAHQPLQSAALDVALCIPTCRRPVYLAHLLKSVVALHTGGLSVRTVVVDNEETRSAEPIVRSFATRLPGLIYAVEPRRGISTARNRLVALASGVGAEYIAFVDDDEWVEPAWLAGLVGAARRYRADVVAGPVLPDFEPDVPTWIRRGGFFNRRCYETGEQVGILSTSNLLVRREWLNRLRGPFDQRFDMTGGGDTHMLKRLESLGAKMVWTNDAVVHEHVPISRGNVSWILARRLRVGMSNAQRYGLLDSPDARRFRTKRGLDYLREGLLGLPAGLLGGRAGVLWRLCRCAFGLGILLGLAGFRMEPYRQIEGR